MNKSTETHNKIPMRPPAMKVSNDTEAPPLRPKPPAEEHNVPKIPQKPKPVKTPRQPLERHEVPQKSKVEETPPRPSKPPKLPQKPKVGEPHPQPSKQPKVPQKPKGGEPPVIIQHTEIHALVNRESKTGKDHTSGQIQLTKTSPARLQYPSQQPHQHKRDITQIHGNDSLSPPVNIKAMKNQDPVRDSSFTCKKDGNSYQAVKPKSSNSIGSVRSSSGLVMVLNMILIFMTLMLAVAWRTKVTQEHKRYYEDLDDLTLYFIGALLLPFCLYIAIYLKQLCGCDVHLSHFLASTAMAVLCIIFSVLILVTGGFIAKEINKEALCIEQRKCMHLTGTASCGLIVGLSVLAQGFCHFVERKGLTSFP